MLFERFANARETIVKRRDAVIMNRCEHFCATLNVRGDAATERPSRRRKILRDIAQVAAPTLVSVNIEGDTGDALRLCLSDY